MLPTILRERDGVSLAFSGHSAGGPGSSGAVYCASDGTASRTFAAFSASEDEAESENAIARRLLEA
jgi:hypothetical protein